MLSIDQVRQLESRVEKAVQKISSLTDENRKLADEKKMLQDQVSSLQAREAELEHSVEEFKAEHARIEEGILSALDKLSALEDCFISEESDEAQNGKAQNGNEWNVTPNPEGYSDDNSESPNYD